MPDSPSAPCDVGVVFALETEAHHFASLVRERRSLVGAPAAGSSLEFHLGTLAGRPVCWVVGGAGVAAASRAATLLCDGHRPRRLVSAGFAGGLDPALARGAVAIPARVLRKGEQGLALHAARGFPGAAVGGIVTVDAVVTTAAAKRALADQTGAALVDMESWGVARAATAAGIPCSSIRVLSDGADDELPADIARLVTPQSAFRRAGAALAAIGRKPSAASTLWRLWENAVVDGRTLAEAIERFVAAPPGQGGSGDSSGAEAAPARLSARAAPGRGGPAADRA